MNPNLSGLIFNKKTRPRNDKVYPAASAARLLSGGNGIENLQIPAGQDPFGFAQGRLYGLNDKVL